MISYWDNHENIMFHLRNKEQKVSLGPVKQVLPKSPGPIGPSKWW